MLSANKNKKLQLINSVETFAYGNNKYLEFRMQKRRN